MVYKVLYLFVMCTLVATKNIPTVYKDEPSENEIVTYDFPFVRRAQWGALEPKRRLPLPVPVPYVVIHHSYRPEACADAADCEKAMRWMQRFHMDDRGWWDIGYNFAVGGEGSAYEGRGWAVLGAHALRFNNVSLGICLIGDWTRELPPAQQLKTAKALIVAGVESGYIRADYKLVGHRQVKATECPGDALYREIQTWEHYSPFPGSVADLVDVVEIPQAVRDDWRINGTLNT